MKIRNPFKRATEKKPVSTPVDTSSTSPTEAKTDRPHTPPATPGTQEHLRPITKTDRPRSEQAGKSASPAESRARRSSSASYTWPGSFSAGDSSSTSSSCGGGSSSSSSSCGGGGGGE